MTAPWRLFLVPRGLKDNKTVKDWTQQWSYWERKQWLSNVDLCVIGSGIVGLSCALAMREAHPQAKILVLERGRLPSGGSTKNAGFACFGSISEVLSDLDHHEDQEVFELVSKRADGIALLMDRLGPDAMDYQRHGGYEVFLGKDQETFDRCVAAMPRINALLEPRFEGPVYSLMKDPFGFAGTIPQCVHSPFEGQIDTGMMMHALVQKAVAEGISILNAATVTEFQAGPTGVQVQCEGFELKAARVAVASNGFASQLISGFQDSVKPARAQALITEEIPDLTIKGTFHLDQGYYYFRNMGERILFGGGRNLDIEGETTYEFGTSAVIQDRLDTLLREVILPGQKVKVAHRWSGIMGVGPQKLPIIERLSDRVVCGVRMCGMGIALGSCAGREMVQRLLD